MNYRAIILILIFVLSLACAGCVSEKSGVSGLSYYTEQYPPFNYEENGTLKGISVDLIVEMTERMGSPVEADQIVLAQWSEAYQEALGSSDVVLFSMARLPERENLFKWAGPIISSDNALLADTTRGIRVADAADLGNLKIGVITDTSSIILLKDLGVEEESLILRDSAEELIAMLDEGSIDAWATGELPGLYLIGQYSSHPQSYAAVYTLGTNDYYYAFSSDTPDETVAVFQEALDDVMNVPDETGTTGYQRILYRYLEPGCAQLTTVTAADATELVELTAADIADDAARTLELINAGEHPYLDADNEAKYVFVYDTGVTLVADAGNPEMVGLSLSGTTDVAGTPFRDSLVEDALENGSGWVDYVFTSPVESGLFHKSAYYELVEGSDGKEYVVCCGIYRACE